jgi:hypothetical protein
MRAICRYPGCENVLGVNNKTGLCRSDNMRMLHRDPQWDARHRARSSERMKGLFKDPEFLERFVAAAKERGQARYANDPKWVARFKAGNKKKHQEPEFAAANVSRARACMVAFNADPVNRARSRKMMAEINQRRSANAS